MRVKDARGRFRRLRCAADVGRSCASSGSSNSRSSSAASSRWSISTASRPGAIKFDRPAAGRHLSRQDPELGAIRRSGRSIRDLNLPDAKIAVIRRSDGSGTTFNFTDYLSQGRARNGSEKVGSDLLVTWPAGTGAKGNEGVSQAVQQTKNSIGYVEFAQALQTKLSYAAIQNRGRQVRQPGPAELPGRGRERGMGEGQRLPSAADRCAGRRRLSRSSRRCSS